MALEDLNIPTPQEIAQDGFTTARELLIICTMLKAHAQRQQAQIDDLRAAAGKNADLATRLAEVATRLAKLEGMTFPPSPEAKKSEPKGKPNAAD